jgi:hypothetical protein
VTSRSATERFAPARVPQPATLLERRREMRGVLLWLVGIPIPIIILLYLFNVI